MDTVIAPIFLFLIFTGAAYYVLEPFLAQPLLVAETDDETIGTALELRKISLYKQIRETEFEHEIGMTAREDFERTRQELVVEAAEVWQTIEGSSVEAQPVALDMPPPVVGLSCPNCGTPAGLEARFCADCGSALGKVCSQCGTQAGQGDRFCNACGRGLVG